MALVKCKDCGQGISDQVKACPQCGSPQGVSLLGRVGQLVKYGALGFVGLIVLAGVAGSNAKKTATAQVSAAPAAAPTPAPPAPVKAAPVEWIHVTARDLAGAWDANEVAAEAKYLGKYLAITGALRDISSAGIGDAYITLEAGGLLASVQCFFAQADSGALATLRKGQNVRVTGLLESKFGNWMVKGCKIQ